MTWHSRRRLLRVVFSRWAQVPPVLPYSVPLPQIPSAICDSISDRRTLDCVRWCLWALGHRPSSTAPSSVLVCPHVSLFPIAVRTHCLGQHKSGCATLSQLASHLSPSGQIWSFMRSCSPPPSQNRATSNNVPGGCECQQLQSFCQSSYPWKIIEVLRLEQPRQARHRLQQPWRSALAVAAEGVLSLCPVLRVLLTATLDICGGRSLSPACITIHSPIHPVLLLEHVLDE